MERSMMNSKRKIFIIDDELAPRESLRMVLKERYDVFSVSGALEGYDFLRENPVDLIILDIKMPKIDGITALKEIKKGYPDLEVILLTAYASLETAKEAIRLGAFDYLMKPFDKDDVINVVERGLKKKSDSEMIKLERERLVNRTSILEEQITKARDNIVKCYKGTVTALNLTIDAKDHYTYNHSNRVVELSSALARGLGLSDNIREKIEHAAAIHDIGKIGVDEKILNKAGRLTPEEYEGMKKHPEIGAKIVESVPFLEEAVPVIFYHHERFDGKGYPEGLKANEIPLSARVVMVADAIDSMMHSRPYRSSLPLQKVIRELTENSGTQFDPVVVDVILSGVVPLQQV
jgi:putative nucleotidyltransferase with HDIG domain